MMEIKLNVDETQFKDILEKELKDLPKEVLQEVIVKAIQGYFEQNNYENVQKLFLKENGGYNSWDTKITTTEFLNGLVNDCDYSGLQDVVDEAIKSVRDNHKEILGDMILRIITNGFFQDYNFRHQLEDAILNTIHRIRN